MAYDPRYSRTYPASYIEAFSFNSDHETPSDFFGDASEFPIYAYAIPFVTGKLICERFNPSAEIGATVSIASLKQAIDNLTEAEISDPIIRGQLSVFDHLFDNAADNNHDTVTFLNQHLIPSA